MRLKVFSISPHLLRCDTTLKSSIKIPQEPVEFKANPGEKDNVMAEVN
jgi:hypothetical protein